MTHDAREKPVRLERVCPDPSTARIARLRAGVASLAALTLIGCADSMGYEMSDQPAVALASDSRSGEAASDVTDKATVGTIVDPVAKNTAEATEAAHASPDPGPLRGDNAYNRVAADVQFSETNVPGRIAELNAGWADPNQHLYAQPDSGYIGADGVLRLGRVADPLDPSKKVLLMRRVLGDRMYSCAGTCGTSHRIEIANYTWHRPIKLGDEMWIGYAARMPQEPFAVQGLIMQLHFAFGAGDTIRNPPYAMLIDTDGRIRFIERWSTNGPPATVQSIQEFTTERPIDRAQWQYFAIKMRRHWDKSYGPYSEVYHAQGPNGAMSKVYSRSGPNTYRSQSSTEYWKFGQYWMGDPHASGSVELTTHVKGFLRWNVADVPNASAANVIAYLRSL